MSSEKKLPNKKGWYWVIIEGYDEPGPQIIVPKF